MFSCEKKFQLCCKRRPTTDVLFWVMLGFARICVPWLCRTAKIVFSALAMWGRGKANTLARAHVSTVWQHNIHYCKQQRAHIYIEEQKRHARDCFDFSFSWGQLQNSSQTSSLGTESPETILCPWRTEESNTMIPVCHFQFRMFYDPTIPWAQRC